MSCCGGKCGSGSGCESGGGCGGCKRYPDFEEKTTTETLIMGVPPQKAFHEGGEMAEGAESGCKYRSNCTCDPCIRK